MNGLPALPVVVRRSKRFGFVLVVVTGLPLWLALPKPLPTLPIVLATATLPGVLPFLLGCLLGVLLLLRPARLMLIPEGLMYERLLRFWRRS